MPIYEYMCDQCHARFSKLVRGFQDPEQLQCPRCQNTNVRRAVSRVSVVRSEDARLDAMADPSMFSGLDENDPVSVARWAKKVGRGLGDDMGDDWESMVDEMLEEELGGEQSESSTSGAMDDLGWG